MDERAVSATLFGCLITISEKPIIYIYDAMMQKEG
jgi:hypothetical protein